jgi:hypothetical protein
VNVKDQKIVVAALATMQRRNLPIGRLAQMKRICAVHGTAWAARYREVGGLWQLEGCIRPSSGGSTNGTPSSNIVIDVGAIKPGAIETCPWCGCGAKEINGDLISHVMCSGCDNAVCLGRTVGTDFRCCDQCGTKGKINGTYTSYDASEVRNEARGALGNGRRTSALPAPSRMQLTNGGRR